MNLIMNTLAKVLQGDTLLQELYMNSYHHIYYIKQQLKLKKAQSDTVIHTPVCVCKRAYIGGGMYHLYKVNKYIYNLLFSLTIWVLQNSVSTLYHLYHPLYTTTDTQEN